MKPDPAIADLDAWSKESGRMLHPLPASLYTSKELLEREVHGLFYKQWVCAGHVSEISAAGDYFTFDLVDKPLLIVRDSENKVRAYSNVCRHRGTLLATGTGNRSAFSCPYHAWTYDLSGCLRSAPYMDKDKVTGIYLPEYPVETWQGFIFVSVNPDVEPLSPRLEVLAERMSPYNIADYVVVERSEIEVACNWKVLVENFCESYHVFKVHAETLEPGAPTISTKVLEGGTGFNHHTMHLNTSAHHENILLRLPDHLRELIHLICIYPCSVFSLESEAVIWLSIRPTGPQSLKYTLQIALHPGGGSDLTQDLIDHYKDIAKTFMAEDKTTIELVQRGLASNDGNSGLLHPWERTNWEFGHYLVRQLLGKDRMEPVS